MQIPDNTQDERARIESLKALNLLDTESEERFDRLTRMARKLFNVPIALVTLVDEDRQWFKSCMGLNIEETSRDISFCGHAILGDELFIIPDATEDPRFSDNPLVTGSPHIHFYAGCPIKSPDGYKLGTLCIIDTKPRLFYNDELESLVDLASMVEHELAALQLATMDELTRISNRRGFIQLAQHSIPLCLRHNLPLTLAFMGLDNFKPINDHFGHNEGDWVLSKFAEQLVNTFRKSDIIARLDGGEFVVLFTNLNKEGVKEIVDRLRAAIDRLNEASGKGYTILFSYGVVQFDPEKHETVEALLSDGDTLMHKTKKSKKIVY